VIPVITPAQMAAIDSEAMDPPEVLIDRAARAVAREAIRMLGGVYGRRVAVVVGPGNNGADGRLAAGHLQRRGVRVQVFEVAETPQLIDSVDLVIDAAFGTGLSRPYSFPGVEPGVAVLAVDIPSGVDGLTGELFGAPVIVDRTITFAAMKPGLLLEPGRSHCGDVVVADIGLDVSRASVFVVGHADLAEWVRARPADDHKWRTAVRVIGASRGMEGAGYLAAAAAQRVGAGLVQLASPGGAASAGPVEAVSQSLPITDWGAEAVGNIDRLQAVLLGPGLGRDDLASVQDVLAIHLALVIDGDALVPELMTGLSARPSPTVLTPHDGEWRRLGGDPSPDRIAATVDMARSTGAVVVRKGPTTVVASPSGRARIVSVGTPALATAGTGDVLAGLVVGLLAQGIDAFDAATAAAQIHAEAAALVPAGLVAHDLLDRLPHVLAQIGETQL
jgi:ADP-dependent NAD(P)H-hydrate dehydratase / NAD(P)H-hydrate epimerase